MLTIRRLETTIYCIIVTFMNLAEMTTSLLLRKETNLMVQAAITSASKHGIKLKQGTPNPGTGDCSFEAVIQNNNNRTCYREKYEMSINWYRSIWATDMANRARHTPYNIFTDQQWQEGWAEMMIPGIYERGLFGDLMLAGIACGIKKILLIFNTNPDTPHDPIYVVNPSQFNVQADSEIPITLAYNMSHYESMEPCRDLDIQATIDLVKEYQEGRYRYGKKDIPYLLAKVQHLDSANNNSRNVRQETKQSQEDIHENFIAAKKARRETSMESQGGDFENQSTSKKTKKRPKEDQVSENKNKYRHERSNKDNVNAINLENISEHKEENNQFFDENIDLDEIDEYLDSQPKVSPLFSQDGIELCYRMKNNSQKIPIKEDAGKLECPICKLVVKNVHLHFERKKDCGKQIDMVHFSEEYERYKKAKDRKRIQENTKRTRQKQKQKDLTDFQRRQTEATIKYQE